MTPGTQIAPEPVDTFDKLDGMSYEDLNFLHARILNKSGTLADLPSTDLELFVAVSQKLRKKTSGPPAKAKPKKGGPSLGDLA